MMASRNAQLCQAVADRLNNLPNGTFTPSFTAVRRYQFIQPMSELGDDLHVSVTPAREGTELAGRGYADHLATAGITIRKKVKPDDLDDLDDLTALAEQIKDTLIGQDLELASGEQARWIASAFVNDLPLWAPNLYEEHTFTTQVTSQYAIEATISG